MMMDAVVKRELESDSDGDVPLGRIRLQRKGKARKTEPREHIQGGAASIGVIKCEYESDPEYDDELLRIGLEQRGVKMVPTEHDINAGSDLDSEEEEDDVIFTMVTSRVAFLYFDTPEDPEPPVPSQEQPPSTTDYTATLSDLLFRFRWLPFPNPAIPLERRREPFKVWDVGPTVPDMTPLEFFKHIWDPTIMGKVVAETNKYAKQLATKMAHNSLGLSRRPSNWKDTTVEEMYVFFGIILAMGVVVKSRIVEYWNQSDDIFDTPGFRANMSLHRFQLLCKHLHFYDNSQIPQNLGAAEARIIKIDPIIQHLNRKFQSMYNMGQNISLDESLLHSRLMKKKSIGIKSYEVCESRTGYLWRFIIHSQSSRSQEPQDSLTSTPSLVLKILEGLEHKGYTVWMDSFYNSPSLARKLKRLGFDCAGTLRTNRQFVPGAICQLEKCHIRPGQVTGVTSGDVDLMVWRGPNRVATISTYHGNFVTTDTDGTTKPVLIRDYASILGGLERKDQLLGSYPIERKQCRVWYKKLFRRLLNVTVLNSFILHKQQTASQLDHREFRRIIILGLLNNRTNLCSVPEKFDLRRHYLDNFPFLASSKGRLRRKCAVCRRLTTMFCVACSKSVCLACFPQLHTQQTSY